MTDYPIHIDAMSMELSILYFKGLSLKILQNDVFLSMKIVFILSYNEMPFLVAFYLGPTVCQSTCLPVSRMKRVEIESHQKLKLVQDKKPLISDFK